MPRFQVIETYTQAVVVRTMIVEAPTLEDAREDPHAWDILASGLDIDEGGEAYTAEIKKLSPRQFKAAKKSIEDMPGRR